MSLRTALPALCCLVLVAACGRDRQPNRQDPLSPGVEGCAGLDEGQCNARPACVALYGGVTEPGTVAPAVLATSGCVGLPSPGGYLGCTEADPCAALDEATCSETAGCAPVYGGAVAVGAPDGVAAPIAPEDPTFAGCSVVPTPPPPTEPVCPAYACLVDCEYGQVIAPDGCPTCACNDAPPAR